MFEKRGVRRDMTDIQVYTARKLNDMAGSLKELAKAFDAESAAGRSLSREDGLAAMQMAGAMVCGDCRRCGLYTDSEREDSYYLYYLLRAFEQKGNVDSEDMPRLFRETCRRQTDYVGHLNRNLGRATMNLSWKNRFLESRDTVISQFRELAVILEEFSRQMEAAVDLTPLWERSVRRAFARNHMVIEHLLILEYDNKRKEAFLTVRTNHGRCLMAREAAKILGDAMGKTSWSVARDSKNIVTRQPAAIRFLEEGAYQVLYGAARMPKSGETISGDNYTFCHVAPGQVVLSLSDGMGAGATAGAESCKVVELTEQLLAAGYMPRSALKLVNTVLLLAGEEQHPATIDLGCIDLYTGVLEMMKLGAAATYVISDEGVELLQACQVPAGVLQTVEPVLISRKLWEDSRVIMVSDGVLEALPGVDKEQVMLEYLEGIVRRNPQDMSEEILDFALGMAEADDRGVRDDMTVLVAGIWRR